MMQLRDAMSSAIEALAGAKVETAHLDARLLLEAVTGQNTASLIAHPDRVMSSPESERLATLLARRVQREPMSHLLGRREFWSLDFLVTRDTLDPRPDSETLVESVLRYTPNRAAPLRVLDMGTGTGCLLLSLLSELPNAFGIGVDISPEALDVAQQNAMRLGFSERTSFHCSNWGQKISGQFDIIISNPPYIADADIETLAPEVARYEPRLALSGGADGLDAYRALSGYLPDLLNPKGFAVLEMGASQAEDVQEILAGAGLDCMESVRDLAGHTRCWVVTPGMNNTRNQPN